VKSRGYCGTAIVAAAAILVFTVAGCEFPGRGSSRTETPSESETLHAFSSTSVPRWAEEQGFADQPAAVSGARIFTQVGCLNCHTYLGAGAASLGAPDLSAIGKDSSRDAEGFAEYVADPSQFGNDVMPHFEDLGRARLRQLGAFLEASQGRG
jgi:mono/diheme cytochrome c family protein